MRPNTPQVATYKSPHDIKQNKHSILGLPLSSSRANKVNQTIPDSQKKSTIKKRNKLYQSRYTIQVAKNAHKTSTK